MHASLLMALAVAAAPAELKLAMPGLHLTDMPAERASFYTEQLATELISRGLRVVTEREMGALLGLERQKELLGCADSSCMVELANALGAEGLVLGEIAKVGNRVQVSLRVVDATSGKTLAIAALKAQGEEELVDGLSKAAATLAIDVPKALGRQVPAEALPPTTTSGGFSISRRAWWVPALGTALLLGASAACFVVSRNDYASLDPLAQGTLTHETAQATASRGNTLQQVSVALLVTGVAAALATVAVGVFGSDTRPIVALSPAGASFSLVGSFP